MNSKNKNRKNRGKAISKKIIAENFPDLMKDMNLQIKETIPKVGKKEARKGGKERERERVERNPYLGKLPIIKEKEDLKSAKEEKNVCPGRNNN